jgi:chaperone modulatory protein CbpM
MMNIQSVDSIWLDENDLYSTDNLIELSGLSDEEVRDLVENGVIVPVEAASTQSTQPGAYRLRYVITAKTARRLRDDFELDRHGVTLALTLLRRISELEAELREVRAKYRLSGGNRSRG